MPTADKFSPLTARSGGLASEPDEAPVAVDQKQVAGEMKVLTSEITGFEF
jgi:hypothetical protein